MLASVLSALIFLLLPLLFPSKPKPVKDYDKLLLVNEYKYKIYEVFSLIPLFFFTGVICYAFYLLGNDVQEVYFRGREANFAIYPPASFWLVPGMCFGIGLLMPPMELLYHLMLKEEYPVYLEYTNRKYGFDGYRVVRFLGRGCLLAGVLVSVLGLGWYKEVKGDKIVINDFGSLTPQAYTMQDVTSVTHYKYKQNSKGEVEAEPHYRIRFSDGRVWDTSDNFHEVSEEKYRAIVSYITSNANLELRHESTDPAD
ncbi:hypothetical protein [Pontibacter flavimaris]|uniref:Uncharacterized protein n=1 Tax=Pontibacter flavimaris TaxID=1797110 RepID=A0A1Q5PA78_9BACT|nr:hypothetical protein [Pontibacter flavimaris]OKL39146.1 hypothetical protein A3841_04150 [Pontibacter flavimaris]